MDFKTLDYQKARERIRFQYWMLMALMVVVMGGFFVYTYFQFPQIRLFALLLGGILALALIDGLITKRKGWPEMDFIDTAEKLGIRLRASRKGGNFKEINPPDYEEFFGDPQGEVQWGGKSIGVSMDAGNPGRQSDARYDFFGTTFGYSMTVFEVVIPDKGLNLMLTKRRRELGTGSLTRFYFSKGDISDKSTQALLQRIQRKTIELPSGWFAIFWDKDDPLSVDGLTERLGKFCTPDFWGRLNSLAGEHTIVLQNGKFRLLAQDYKCQLDQMRFYLDLVVKLLK
jgi:hypothetical protein